MPTTKEKRPTQAEIKAMSPDERRDRADELVPGLRDKARQQWIETGKNGREQVDDARLEAEKVEAMARHRRNDRSNGRGATKGKPADVEAANLATDAAAAKGKALSQRVRPVEIAKIRRALRKMGDGEIHVRLGFTSEATLRRFVAGTLPTKDLTDDAKRGVKELAQKVGDHQVWARKAAAGALGIALQERS